MRVYSLTRRQQGITLIEVLIAILIFSVGLIGLAGLLVFATQSNHSAYLRTQVTFLANSMADRMRANPAGVWKNAYNSDDYPVSITTVPDCASGCDPADVATHDQALWSSMLTGFLPGGKAKIQCTDTSLVYKPGDDQMAMRPPYGGNCSMTITWNQRGVADDRSAKPETFAWVFQP
ncbi:MAG: type IV pilus modification protein PilV [Xanthomonadales bacterium]|nr:type IV pilus modification protein PilV [Xanthomonadales bacterium]